MRLIRASSLLMLAAGCSGPSAPNDPYGAVPECYRQLGNVTGEAVIFITAGGICPEGGLATLAADPVLFRNVDARPHRMAAFRYPDPAVPEPMCSGFGVGLLAPGESRTGAVHSQCVQCTVHDALDPTNRAYWVTIRTAPC